MEPSIFNFVDINCSPGVNKEHKQTFYGGRRQLQYNIVAVANDVSREFTPWCKTPDLDVHLYQFTVTTPSALHSYLRVNYNPSVGVIFDKSFANANRLITKSPRNIKLGLLLRLLDTECRGIYQVYDFNNQWQFSALQNFISRCDKVKVYFFCCYTAGKNWIVLSADSKKLLIEAAAYNIIMWYFNINNKLTYVVITSNVSIHQSCQHFWRVIPIKCMKGNSVIVEN